MTAIAPVWFVKTIQYAGLLGLLLYLSIGTFPLTMFETDAMSVLAGCKRMIETGRFGENEYTYYFHSQPGIYGWVIGIQQIAGISFASAYSLASGLFGLLFIGFSASFIARLLNAGFIASLLCLLLFQEIYTACFYMNSATGAAFFMMAAFCVVYNRNTPARLVCSGLLLALGAWTRVDVSVAFPVVFFLVKVDTIRQRAALTTVIFGAFAAAFSILCWVSNAHNVLFETLQGSSSLSFVDNQQTAHSFVSSQFVRVLIGYFPVLTVLLMLIGVRHMLRGKHWQLLSVCLLPVCLFIILIGGRLVAGKHLLYYTPFFSIPVLISCQELYRTGFQRVHLFVKVLLAISVLQYVMGVQVALEAYPYSNSPYASTRPYPTFYTLATISSPFRQIDRVEFVIGGGTKLATSDELLLSSGILFSPLMWSHLKKDTEADQVAIQNYLALSGSDTLHITASQGSASPIRNLLYLWDYRLLKAGPDLCQSASIYQWTWRKNKRVIVVNQSVYPKKDYLAYIKKLTASRYPSYLHLAFWDWERWYLHRYNRHTDTLRHVGYLFGRKPVHHAPL